MNPFPEILDPPLIINHAEISCSAKGLNFGLSPCTDPEGNRGPDPLKNHKNIGWSGSPENHKANKPAIIGRLAKRHLNGIQCDKYQKLILLLLSHWNLRKRPLSHWVDRITEYCSILHGSVKVFSFLVIKEYKYKTCKECLNLITPLISLFFNSD